jgi:hypothetical protein
MKTTMDIVVRTQCPVDGDMISLSVTVYVGEAQLMVETLLDIIRRLVAMPTLQEDFTRSLALELSLPVKTVGVHSGVTITCEA